MSSMFERFFEDDPYYVGKEDAAVAVKADAIEFGVRLKDCQLSMANIQGYLMSFLRKEKAPQAALANCVAYFNKDKAKPNESMSKILFHLPTVGSTAEDEQVIARADRFSSGLQRSKSLPNG